MDPGAERPGGDRTNARGPVRLRLLPCGLLAVTDVGAILRVARAAACQITAEETFPAPGRLCARVKRWPAEAVLAWCDGLRRAGSPPIRCTCGCPTCLGRLVTAAELRAWTRTGRTTSYAITRRADFPAAVEISPRCLRWPAVEGAAWLAALSGRPADTALPADAALPDPLVVGNVAA